MLCMYSTSMRMCLRADIICKAHCKRQKSTVARKNSCFTLNSKLEVSCLWENRCTIIRPGQRLACIVVKHFDVTSIAEIAMGTVYIVSFFFYYFWKKYTSGPRYWNVPVLVNTGTFLVYQYCLKLWYLCSLECAGVIQKLTILECKNDLVLSNTRVPVSGTWSILFPYFFLIY